MSTDWSQGSNEPPPVENWRVIRRLIGHDNDVQDLGWSHDSSILVSVGLDSKVVVWSGYTFEKLKTLSQHQSHVKGITFDPANKYFATASDDRTIKIYRWTPPPPNATAHDQINNFVLELSVTAPFSHSPLTTYFRRCSWSPDGNHIAAANATNGPVSAVAIVDRGSWDSQISLIGHEGPVEACAFSPRLFYREKVTQEQVAASNYNIQSVTVIACAGQDKSLSVWNTSFARPLLIYHEVASKSIADLAWTPDGETLYLCSLDGSIQAVIFEEGELGFAAPEQENERSLQRYGAGRKTGVVESTDALLLEESSKAGELKGAQGRMGELMGDQGPGVSSEKSKTNGLTNGVTAVPIPTINGTANEPSQPASDPRVEKLKQRVEITKDGKKRIKPLLVSSSSGIAESSLPQTQLVSGATQGAAGGLRSDAPINTIDLSKPYDGFPKGGLAALMVGNKRKFAEIEGDEERRTEKRLSTSAQNGSAPIVMNSAEGLIPPRLAARSQEDGQALAALRPAIVNSALSVSQVRLAVPLIRSVIQRTVDGSEPPKDTSDLLADRSEDTVVVEARNASGPSRTGRPQDRDPARINCTKQGQSLWQDYLPKPVLLVTGNPHFWAAACEDGSIHVWTPAGRRLLNALILEAAPVIMDCRGWWLMAISAVGQCYVWNIRTLSSPHPPISLAPVLDIAVHSQGPHLTTSPGIVFARLNSNGRIVIAMSDGGGYTYNSDMFIWQRLSEPWWAVGSQYWNTADGGTVDNVKGASKQQNGAGGLDSDEVSLENISAGIIPMLERNTTNHTLLRGRAYFLQRLIKALLVAEGFEGFEAGVSIAHLENRVAAAMSLGAREEFRIYLLMYAKRLGAEGHKGKIEELLRSLLGDIFDTEGNEIAHVDEADGKGWHSKEARLVGWDRQELLKDVVVVLGKRKFLVMTLNPEY